MKGQVTHSNEIPVPSFSYDFSGAVFEHAEVEDQRIGDRERQSLGPLDDLNARSGEAAPR
jgi:hypothetical protein